MPEKYKREIEEILELSGDLSTDSHSGHPKISLAKLMWLHVKQSLKGETWSISPGRIVLISLFLVIAALVTGILGLGFAGILGWSGLLLFIIGYAMLLVRPPRVEKRWRGKVIENGGNSWWSGLRRRIK